ncbi:MAG: YiiX/YebB-like N1pC/P60 family cysteine hydrolase [Deltaproteobacteria bacterium]|nr:YiiX/YebB-like N1pC/P60 family cysteine hydrolase [Deltaproteobacteria bacterium]
MAKYEDIRGDIKTGDVILFSGKGTISNGIKLFTSSKWSHVGMVLKLPDSKANFLWESTTLSNLKDAISGTVKNGVQLVLLRDRLRTYDGEKSIRHLSYSITADEYYRLMGFREKMRGRPYETNRLELIKSAYDGPFGHNEEDLSSLFCSELVAEAYQEIGLLDNNKPSNEYTPKDFSDVCKLNLLRGSLGKEIKLEV